ncbi:MAG: hypothetical protein ACYC55_10330 [Candidatus Geothermincolia bacterium]
MERDRWDVALVAVAGPAERDPGRAAGVCGEISRAAGRAETASVRAAEP